MRVAILGSNDRAALTAVRQLSLEPSINRIIILRDKKQKSLACVSKHTDKSIYCPFEPDNIDEVIKTLKNEGVGLVLPINDVSSLFVANNYDAFCSHFKLASPTPSSFYQAFDKWRIKELCDGKTLKFPESIFISRDDKLADLSIPSDYVYFKTRNSVVFNNGQYRKYGVRRIDRCESKFDYITDHLAFTDVICQKPLVGIGVGLNVLAKDGELIAVNKNERIHQPKDGGGSSYRQTSIEIDHDLMVIARQIVHRLQWSGVMMIELLETSNGYYLVEINPRFWGSLPLTEFSGANFVRNLYRQTIGMELVPASCRKVTARHLINDVRWLMKNFSVKESIKLLASPIQVMRNQEQYDVERLSDFVPALYQINELAHQISRSINHKLYSQLLKKLLNSQNIKIWQEIKNGQQYVFADNENTAASLYAEYYIKNKGYTQFFSAATGTPALNNRLPAYRLLKERSFNRNLIEYRSKNIERFRGSGFNIIALDLDTYIKLTADKFNNVVLFCSKGIDCQKNQTDANYKNSLKQIEKVIDEKVV